MSQSGRTFSVTAQVRAQLGGRWPSPVPEAVIDRVDDEAGLEHEGVRDRYPQLYRTGAGIDKLR
jgi:hypothetical protein